MASSGSRRWPLRILLIVIAIVALLGGGRYFATQKLEREIKAALGPNSQVSRIEVGFSSITLTGIRIEADKGWPAKDELSAERVVVTPDWGALLSRNIRISSIEIDGAYLSMLRHKDGKLLVLPSLLQQAPEKAGKSEAPEVLIGTINLSNAAVDFYDASVRRPAHKLRLEKTRVAIGQLRLPALTGQTSIDVDGVVKGVNFDGKLSVNGWAELASRDSDIQTKLAGVDLVTFQPYLIKAAETGVKKGSLDLNLKSTVKKKRLHAPGRVTLSGLELATGGTFMGMPREAVIGMMKDKQGRITADFVLQGDIDDPKFSLNENFMAQVGSGTAKFLGISLEGLATGIGSAGGAAVEGIGSAVGKLLGGKK
ncbi:MAG: DUF748 domain-containing protein [Rhodocyclaceae bacterium]